MNQQSKTTFSISQASEMTGVSKNRIREWHEKGFLPEVLLISVGSRLHRRFTEKDMQVIQRINDYSFCRLLLRRREKEYKEE